AGFNSVRLPILSSLVDEPATAFCRSGLAWIHTAVNLARANGLYVVLDLHGAPGGQSNADHTGQVNQNQLWYGWKNIPNLEAVWKQLAAEFKG
ncbi:cellulase family glycosylhydrolase, partial [Acinetobacter baumannii]